MNEPTDEAASAVPVVPLEPRAPSPKAGQRWRDTGQSLHGRRGTPHYCGEPFTLTKQSDYGGWHDDRSETAWTKSGFTNGRLAFVDHGEPAPTMETCGSRDHLPARCLRCGGEKPVEAAYTCWACHRDFHAEHMELTHAWQDGARDFPRPRAQEASPAPAPETPWIAQGQGSDVPEAPKPKAPLESGRTVTPAESRGNAEKEATKQPIRARREVSSNGREWIKYDALVDADPFTSYRWHRERVTMSDGTWTETAKGPAEPRGYNGTWANHTFLDRERRMVMDKRDDEGRPDRDSPPPSHPLQREARVTLFGGVWNLRGGR